MIDVLKALTSPQRVGLTLGATMFVVVLGGIRAATEGGAVVTPSTIALTVSFVFVWLFVSLTGVQLLQEWYETDCGSVGTSFEPAVLFLLGIIVFIFAGDFTTGVFANGGLDPAEMVVSVLSWTITTVVIIGAIRLFFALRR